MKKTMQNKTRKVADKFILRELSVYEKAKLEKKRLEHKENIIKTQIVQGKVYKGPGFRCSNKIIEFKDFEVGKVYKKKLHLTNVSLSFNSFKFLEIKDTSGHNFEIEYIPAGRISAGISVNFKLIFFPQAKKNVEINLPILCETGKINIPVKCYYKKTEVIIEEKTINFGTTILGEKKIRKIKLKNIGGLATNFEIRNNKGKNINASFASINGSLSVISNDSIEEENESTIFEKRVDSLFFLNEMRIEYEKKLNGYDENEITFIYTPQKIKDWEVNIIVYFDIFLDQSEIVLKLEGKSSELPISSVKDTYDLGICIFDSVYKEKIIFTNKSNKTSKIKIVAPSETKDFFQFNPGFTYIQPKGQSIIWMKLIMSKKIKRYCEKFRKNNSLIVPFKLNCSEQKIPVDFEIRLEFSDTVLKYPKKLNFGSLYENTSKVLDLEFSNKSLLVQKLFFYSIPESISFEPNPIPIIIMPKSDLKLQIIYKSAKIIKEEGKIKGKVIIGKEKTKEIEINYKAESIKCPLKFSALRIDFQTNQPKEYSVYLLNVQNIIYKDYIIEIQPPPFEYSGIKISPLVRQFNKEMSVKFPVEYYSDFRDISYDSYCKLEVKNDEFLNSSYKIIEDFEKERTEIEEEVNKKKGKKNDKYLEKINYLNDTINDLNEKIRLYKEDKEKNFDIDKILEEKGGKMHKITENNINYQFFKWLIPVYFKPLNEPDTFISKLFLEVNTCVRNPSLICNKIELDFGTIALGYKNIKNIELENKGDKIMDLKMDILPLYSGFQLLTVLTPLEVGEKKVFAISFDPEYAKNYLENLKIYSENSINLVLKGKAEYPVIIIKDDKKFIDMGACLVGEFIEKSFFIINKGPFKLKFNIIEEKIGVDNQNDKNSFVFFPNKDYIMPDEEKEIKVYFNPKNKGENFFSYIKINVDKQQNPIFVFIKANSFFRQSYVRDYFDYSPEFIDNYIEKNNYKLNYIKPVDLYRKKINFIFKKKENKTEKEKLTKKKIITVGSCNLKDKKLEKPVEFEIILENSEFNNLINIDNLKGKINPGSFIDITFSYTEKEFDPDQQISILKDFDKFFFIKGILKVSGGFFNEEEEGSVEYPIEIKVYRKIIN